MGWGCGSREDGWIHPIEIAAKTLVWHLYYGVAHYRAAGSHFPSTDPAPFNGLAKIFKRLTVSLRVNGCALKKVFLPYDPFRIPKNRAHHFADKTVLNFFGDGSLGCFQTIDFFLVLGVKWCTHVSSPVTILLNISSPSCSYHSKKSRAEAMWFLLCSGDNWWRTHCVHTLQNSSFSITIWEIDIHESESPKLLFVIVFSSRNVKRRSSLSSEQIVLTDSSATIFGQPARNSCSSHHPSWNSQHLFLTICTPMMSLQYTSVSCTWIQPHAYFSPLKIVSLQGVHMRTRTRWVAPCSSYYSPCLLGRSDQPKIQCCHNPRQNISPNFHSIWTRWRGEKMGNLRLGQLRYYVEILRKCRMTLEHLAILSEEKWPCNLQKFWETNDLVQYVSKETLVKVEKSNKKAQKSKKNPLWN